MKKKWNRPLPHAHKNDWEIQENVINDVSQDNSMQIPDSQRETRTPGIEARSSNEICRMHYRPRSYPNLNGESIVWEVRRNAGLALIRSPDRQRSHAKRTHKASWGARFIDLESGNPTQLSPDRKWLDVPSGRSLTRRGSQELRNTAAGGGPSCRARTSPPRRASVQSGSMGRWRGRAGQSRTGPSGTGGK